MASETRDAEFARTLLVDGMMCMKNCGSTVAGALQGVPGVHSVVVDGDGLRRVDVECESGVESSALVAAVESVGFGATVVPPVSAGDERQSVVLDVDGMMCMKNCGSTVAGALQGVPGVHSVVVDSDGLRRVDVECESGVESSALVAAVESVGFGATVVPPVSASAASNGSQLRPQGASSQSSASDRLLASVAQVAARWEFSRSLHGTARLIVRGMTCSACVSRVEQALLGCEGSHQCALSVAHATVSLLGGTSTVEISVFTDLDVANACDFVKETLESCVSGAGYTAEATVRLSDSPEAVVDVAAHHETEVTLQVSGMSCAACSGKVEHALLNVPGVFAATVAVATGSAVVRYNPSLMPGVRHLADICTDLGYPAKALKKIIQRRCPISATTS